MLKLIKLILILKLDLWHIWQLLRVLTILGIENIQIPQQVVRKYFLCAMCLSYLMGLSFLQKLDQVWAEKIIRVMTKRTREILVLGLSDRPS